MKARDGIYLIRVMLMNLKQTVLTMCHEAHASHIGSCLSCIDVLDELYSHLWREDTIILSKGHAAAALYAVLAKHKFINKKRLKSYCQTDGLQCHPSRSTPGVAWSTGSLGHGIGVGCGMAMANKIDKKDGRVVVVVGDGGSNWESLMFGSAKHLDNLIVVVDYNKIQSFGDVNQVMPLHPLGEKFGAFGWDYVYCKNPKLIPDLIINHDNMERPLAIILDSVKGSGVSFMENKLEWHYKSTNEDEYKQAMKELSK
jgi:transketolase